MTNKTNLAIMDVTQLRVAFKRVDRQRSYAWALKYQADEAAQRANRMKIIAMTGLCVSLCANYILLMMSPA